MCLRFFFPFGVFPAPFGTVALRRFPLFLMMICGFILPWSSAAQPLTEWREMVNSGDNVFLDVTDETAVFLAAPRVVGNYAFHLTHTAARITQTVELRPDFLIGEETILFFESRLGVAGTGQEAGVQIKTGSDDWSDLWVKRGTGSFAPARFERIRLPLAAYAGSTVRLRFVYRFVGGTFSPESIPEHGWIFDDIQIGTEFIIEPQLFEVADLSPKEQQLLEFINRARADAPAEAHRLRATTDPDVREAVTAIGVDFDLLLEQFAELPAHLPPLVPSRRLSAAARLHNLDMATNDFQSHQSSINPPAPHQPGDGVGERVGYQAYAFQILSENIYAFAKSTWHAHAAFNIDWGEDAGTGGSVGGMQSPPGHRLTIHSPEFRDIGISVRANSGGTVGPYLVTQVFALDQLADIPIVTGVVWRDLNGNGEYDPGEGLGGLRVDVPGARFYAITTSSGAYAIPMPGDGDYTVRLSGYGGSSQVQTVTVQNRENRKIDFILPEQINILGFEYDLSAGDYRLTLHTRAPIGHLRLQQTTDFRHWADRPETPTQSGHGNTYTFTLQSVDVVGNFFRVLASPP
ncbi:MAG: hypothetical protein JJT96_12345 [Opitutales bacterium]|nr:hypothetical protein [Opitutales bacterium]